MQKLVESDRTFNVMLQCRLIFASFFETCRQSHVCLKPLCSPDHSVATFCSTPWLVVAVVEQAL